MESGARGAGANAPKKQHDLAGWGGLNSRPLSHSASYDFDVPGDSMVKYNYANCDNGNNDSAKAPNSSVSGSKLNPDSHVCTPPGKPLA